MKVLCVCGAKRSSQRLLLLVLFNYSRYLQNLINSLISYFRRKNREFVNIVCAMFIVACAED